MIADGLNRMYEKGEDWPPSAIAFAKLCRPQQDEMSGSWGTGAHKLFAPLALPDKSAQERAEQAGKSELAKLNNLFPKGV